MLYCFLLKAENEKVRKRYKRSKDKNKTEKR